MELTVEILKQIMPQARKSKLEEFLIYLREYYKFAGLDTAKRMSSFLSQLGHESLEFLYMEEIASGKAYEEEKIWVMFASETANVSKDVNTINW
jgi:putative chitinase